jgi:hypothetical protein
LERRGIDLNDSANVIDPMFLMEVNVLWQCCGMSGCDDESFETDNGVERND